MSQKNQQKERSKSNRNKKAPDGAFGTLIIIFLLYIIFFGMFKGLIN